MGPWARVRLTLVAVVITAVAAACGGPDPAAQPLPPVQDPDLVQAGEALYQASCAECHGVDLRGTDKGPSHLSIVYEPSHHGDGAFATAVLIGTRQHHWKFGNMEPVEGLTSDDVEAIIAYVRENQRLSGFEPYPP